MKHETMIEYKSGLKELAEDIGNLRYDTLAEFLELLELKLQNDSEKDNLSEKKMLSNNLNQASFHLAIVKEYIKNAWRLCEKHELSM